MVPQNGHSYAGRIGALKPCVLRYIASQYPIQLPKGDGGLGETLLEPTTFRMVIYFGRNLVINSFPLHVLGFDLHGGVAEDVE